MKKTLRITQCAAAALLVFGAGAFSPARATENGASAYPLGVDTYAVALTPPPGHAVLLNYNEYTSANVYQDTTKWHGSKVGVFVSAFRSVYTWPVTFDGGKVTVSTNAIFGIGSVHLKIPVGGGVQNSSTGLINPCIWPVELTYHSGGTFVSGAFAVWMPLGTYNKNASPTQGLGLNYWSYAPVLYFTQMVGPNLQLNFSSLTEFDGKNRQTQLMQTANGPVSYHNYQSGSAETVSFGAGYTVMPHLQVGPVAYYYDQFSDDTTSLGTYNNGNRGRTFAFGAQALYGITRGSAIGVKYFHDTLVKNRAGGDQFWVDLMIPLG